MIATSRQPPSEVAKDLSMYIDYLWFTCQLTTFLHFIVAARLQATVISQEEARSAEKQPAAKKQKQQGSLPKAKLRPPPLQTERVPSAHPPSTKDPMPPSTPSFPKALEKSSKPELMKPADAIRQQKPGTYIPNSQLEFITHYGSINNHSC